MAQHHLPWSHGKRQAKLSIREQQFLQGWERRDESQGRRSGCSACPWLRSHCKPIRQAETLSFSLTFCSVRIRRWADETTFFNLYQLSKQSYTANMFQDHYQRYGEMRPINYFAPIVVSTSFWLDISASVDLVHCKAEHGAASPLWELEINSTEVFTCIKC